MSPVAETSTNKGDNTSSRPYWSRWFTASDQEFSIFWNSRISGLSAVVTFGMVEAETGATAWFWATAAQQEKSTAEKQAAKRVIFSMNSYLKTFSMKIILLWTRQSGRTGATNVWKPALGPVV